MAHAEPWSEKRGRDVIAAHQSDEGPLLPILHALQETFGYVPREAVPMVAETLNLSRAEVHGVVTFYHDFRREPAGPHVLKMCRAEACQAMGCEATEAKARESLGVDYHGTTADGQFTLEAAYCLGNCAAGPSLMIDDKLYGRVTPARLEELLQQWRSRQ